MRYYLAYGSNLNRQQMKDRCPESKLLGVAELTGYELLFRQGSEHGSFLNLEKSSKEAACVPVAIWQVSEQDEHNLDLYEEFPRMYYKQDVELTRYYLCDAHAEDLARKPEAQTEPLECFLYLMTEGFPPSYPSKLYLETVKEGYDSFGFDTALIEQAYTKSAPLLEL